MKPILVAVGSTRPPKLGAVAEALRTLGPLLGIDACFEVVGREVPSGVSHTPLSRSELMAGARGRAEALLRTSHQGIGRPKYFIGLEGGLNVVQELGQRFVFLESWAFVADEAGRNAYGGSGAVMLPATLVAEVVDGGTELSLAVDAYAGTQGIRDEKGAWGVLTCGLTSRQESFRIALINAFAPFFNAAMYR